MSVHTYHTGKRETYTKMFPFFLSLGCNLRQVGWVPAACSDCSSEGDGSRTEGSARREIHLQYCTPGHGGHAVPGSQLAAVTNSKAKFLLGHCCFLLWKDSNANWVRAHIQLCDHTSGAHLQLILQGKKLVREWMSALSWKPHPWACTQSLWRHQKVWPVMRNIFHLADWKDG